MKIEKSSNDGVIIKDADDAILHIIKATDVYLQFDPRSADMVVISNTPTPQDAYEAIQIPVSKVSSIDGVDFEGDRNALLLALDKLFKNGGGSVTEGLQKGAVFCVWAEESADLGNNAFEWAYGNGNDTPNGMGVVLVFPCELIGLGLTLEGAASSSVEAYKNTSTTGKRVSTSSSKKGFESFIDSPIEFAAGDVINFRTKTGHSSSNGGCIVAWFRIK